ncbi:fatty acid hydroxylase superfamily-domain-containing protein [Pseudomassariella vexata]|uniref:Fatty acid hydroxylase superfamily-domain-containing protein n=1 Tax=Pseudomassariella vexata TaxID=1141098 RepID=A0A1Y2DIT7_9PEZI|nr:fatty acid hydroxylase superfamily-domain-containing protein [Pseudomassariella vexata]ORY59147.1 fatty acid hydroxylase superfamily-domain-containing protein [Pseudomassariella vexata]
MATNMTTMTDLPPLPQFELYEVPNLIPWFPDFYLSLVAPVIAYWILSIFFHIVDIYDIWPQYRLHTPAEITSRNRASRYEVCRDVLIQQGIQMVVGVILGVTDPPQLMGREQYDVALWATRVRLAQRTLPALLGVMGINAASVAKNIAGSHPLLAGALAGGHYPFLTTELAGPDGSVVPAFATWELLVAKAIYWLVVPAIQFALAVGFLDTWQYFLHRWMHMNKWLYATFHSRHHRLYVPYAYGALYNHPFEGFLLDTLGAGLAYKLSFMTARQGIVFFTGSTMKTVDDHCGYSLPWDPLQHISGNNAAYHDIHHQSWGIKTNFSQPFFTIWDRMLGTMWVGETASKYERSRKNAANAVEAEAKKPSAQAS